MSNCDLCSHHQEIVCARSHTNDMLVECGTCKDLDGDCDLHRINKDAELARLDEGCVGRAVVLERGLGRDHHGDVALPHLRFVVEVHMRAHIAAMFIGGDTEGHADRHVAFDWHIWQRFHPYVTFLNEFICVALQIDIAMRHGTWQRRLQMTS